MKQAMLKMGEMTQAEAQAREKQEHTDKLLKAARNLMEYSRAVESDISDRDTGWYYQFKAAIEGVNRAILTYEGDVRA